MLAGNRFTALLAVALIFAVGAHGQALVRQLRSDYLYCNTLETIGAGNTPRDIATFILFYTPNLASQTVDIAVAAKTVGWIGSSMSPSDSGGMADPPGNFGLKGAFCRGDSVPFRLPF